MRNRRNTNKQEPFKLVVQFVASGQSQVMWCKAQGIPVSTSSKWVKEYKSVSEEVKFVSLSPKQTNAIIPNKLETAEPTTNEHSILIEIGPCKMHVPEKIAMTFLMMKVL